MSVCSKIFRRYEIPDKSQLSLFVEKNNLNYFVILKNYKDCPTIIVVRPDEAIRLIELFKVKDVVDISDLKDSLENGFQYYFFINDYCVAFQMLKNEFDQLFQKYHFRIIKKPS